MNQLEVLAAALSLCAAAGYLAAAGLFLKKKPRTAYTAAGLAWLCNLAIFIKNLLLNGYAPFASMYQVLSVLALCFLPICAILTRSGMQAQSAAQSKEATQLQTAAGEEWLWPYFCLPAALPLIGTLFMDKQLKWALVPALQSAWFVPHVLSYMLSYCLAAVAFVLTLVSLGMRGDRKADRLRCESAVYRILRVSFPFMTIGLCFGALWADQVWGNFWQWDVKEIWSLLTALCYLGYFHWRLVPGGKRAAVIWSLLGFASLIITFLCVNLLPSVEESFHLYA